jgi:nanoRNase/pAp phosphatase (c-di-AMP/oligoRNAs hydrolase)
MSAVPKRYRLVTRSDFDGLVCAVLLKHLDLIDDILFVHPKDMQDGKIAIMPARHHDQPAVCRGRPPGLRPPPVGDHPQPRRAREPRDRPARAVGGARGVRLLRRHPRLPGAWRDMMDAVDKGDAARFSREEVLDPRGWNLLNFLMDARTGLGRFHDFRISNYQLMMDLIDACRNHSIAQIMALPDVQERTALYFEHDALCKEQIRRCARVHGNLVVLDLREEETIYAGNRFIIYALFPETNISIHVLWGLKNQNTVFATG